MSRCVKKNLSLLLHACMCIVTATVYCEEACSPASYVDIGLQAWLEQDAPVEEASSCKLE